MPDRDQFTAQVLENVSLCREHYRLNLGLPHFPPTDPGQFIQIACRSLRFEPPPDITLDWEPGCPPPESIDPELRAGEAFLRRPFSLAGRRDMPDGSVQLQIIHRVVGVGTEWLAHLRAGDQVSILGPLGNRFELPPPEHTAILIGGGVGIPPMLYFAEAMKGRSAVAFCGATTKELLALTIIGESDPTGISPRPCVSEFGKAVISTDDGSYGFRGFVTQALERYLDSLIPDHASLITLYTCGPEPMMKRVAEIALARDIPCQIAVERAMACGMGTCQSCCIRVRKPDRSVPPLAGKDWCYRLACTDGPVFRAAELLW